jgi:hypothetical protein
MNFQQEKLEVASQIPEDPTWGIEPISQLYELWESTEQKNCREWTGSGGFYDGGKKDKIWQNVNNNKWWF